MIDVVKSLLNDLREVLAGNLIVESSDRDSKKGAGFAPDRIVWRLTIVRPTTVDDAMIAEINRREK